MEWRKIKYMAKESIKRLAKETEIEYSYDKRLGVYRIMSGAFTYSPAKFKSYLRQVRNLQNRNRKPSKQDIITLALIEDLRGDRSARKYLKKLGLL